MRFERLLIVGLCALVFSTVTASAQNLVSNSQFDQDLSGWIVQEGTVAWSSQDAGESVYSGSMEAAPLDGQSARIRSNCFPASPGNYLAEFKHLEPEPGPDTVTGFVRWYSDASCTQLLSNSVSFSAGHHGPFWETIGTAFFGVDAIAPPGTQSGALQLLAATRAYIDEAVVAREGTCTAETCLNNNRFGVAIRWITGTDIGQGRPVTVTADSATYWFFSPGNVELVVKVLNGCAVNGHYWVFMAGLTNVRVEVTITDVATGEIWTYINEAGVPFPPVQDTSAFLTCP